MKTLILLEKMRKQPVFSSKLVKMKNSAYANLYLYRLEKQNLIKRIERNLYTVYNDPFLIASRIVWPSYISCWSGLKYHNLTEQVPYELFVIIPYYKKQILFENAPIIFITSKNKNLFGYNKIDYHGFEIFIADKEKSIIDSALFKKATLSEVKEIIENNIKDLDLKKFIRYLQKIENKSLIKRFGFLFDSWGYDFYPRLKRYIDKVYILLDYTKQKTGKKNKKWMVIQNA